MLKDNWEEKHGINLPGHSTCAKGIQGTHVGNMILQTSQGFSDNGYLAGSSSRRNLTALAPSGSECDNPRQSNFQDGSSLLVLNGQGNRCGVSINEPKSVGPVSNRHRFDNQFHQQNHLSETRPTFNANPHGNGIEKIGHASHNVVSQLQTMPVMGNRKPIDNVCSQTAHKSLLPLKSHGTDAGKSLIGFNLQELVKFLSTTHGLPMKMLQEMGSSEYLRLVEILQQSSVQPNGFSDGLNGRGCSQEEFSGGSKQSGSYSIVGGTNNTQSVEIASLGPSVSTQDEISRTMPNDGQFGSATEKPKLALADDESSICRDNNKEKISGGGQKTDPILGPLKMDEKKLPSEKAARIVAEKLWDGSLQLSSSVTLSAVAFFKSGEKLLGNSWPEIIEVKGKVRLEAFEKYVQDLPRSRNRGLMVVSLCWKEGSSDTGLTGMKEVAKGYKRTSRVGFAQLLSGIDLYICPRSDPIITILAKYGFFKGMSVIDDNQDSMLGCVVWRKNRSLNPVEPHNPSSLLPIKQDIEKKNSPEKLGQQSGQLDEPVIIPSLASTEVDPCNSVKKRPFEDDDLPEFDFGIVCGKSTLVSQSQSQIQPLNPAIFRKNGPTLVNCQKLDNPRLTQVTNTLEKNTSNGSLDPSSKKTKLFDDDDDDMPEWCPPEIHKQNPPSNFKNLPSCPPRSPPIPPSQPPAGTRPSFSYLPFRPPISFPATTFAGAPAPSPLSPPPSGGFNSNQDLRHRPNLNNNNMNPLFQSFSGRRQRP